MYWSCYANGDISTKSEENDYNQDCSFMKTNQNSSNETFFTYLQMNSVAK